MSKLTKEDVRALVAGNNQDTLLQLFDQDPHRVRRFLIRLSYAPEDTLHRATIDCIRFLAHERACCMPEFFLETIRRHLWAMNEEGGNNAWSAPEIVGAVIAGAPVQFGQFFSYAFCAAIDEMTFQPSLVRAFDLVDCVDPPLVEDYRARIDALRCT